MWTRRAVVLLLSFGVVTGVALAASGAPRPGALFSSDFLTVTVGKPATSVKVFAECLPSSGISGAWTSGKLRLKHDSFKFDRKVKIKKLPKGKIEGTVFVTGTYKGGVFKGKFELGGTSCPKISYRATTEAGGSGR